MKIEIRHKYKDNIILEGEYKSIADCINKNKNSNLRNVDLSNVDLSYAYLRNVDLSNANLSYANLSSADLSYAYLRNANLRNANLSYADLSSAYLSNANVSSADLSNAYLRNANVSSADLSNANLRNANLSYAYLSNANLRNANLSYADLSSAYLSNAKNLNKYLIQPLMHLMDQTGSIRLYKLVDNNYLSPIKIINQLKYNLKTNLEELDADTDDNVECSNGINVATLDWCIKNWKPTHKILIVEFKAKDIACIPIASDGKIRLFRCKVIKEVDLKKIGLI